MVTFTKFGRQTLLHDLLVKLIYVRSLDEFPTILLENGEPVSDPE